MSRPAFDVVVRGSRNYQINIGRMWFHDRSAEGKHSFFSGRLTATPGNGKAFLVPADAEQEALPIDHERWSICKGFERDGGKTYWQNYGMGKYIPPSDKRSEEVALRFDCIPVGMLSDDATAVVAELSLFPWTPREERCEDASDGAEDSF